MPSPTITTMVREASVLKKNQSFANIVTNLNSHNGYEKSINISHDQSKLQGWVGGDDMNVNQDFLSAYVLVNKQVVRRS